MMVLAISGRYNYSRAVTAAVISAAVVVATVDITVIATGSSIRVILTRLKTQCAEGQRNNRKQ